MSGRSRWKAMREISLTREQTWFLKELAQQAEKALPSEGPGYPVRFLVREVNEKLDRALQPPRRRK